MTELSPWIAALQRAGLSIEGWAAVEPPGDLAEADEPISVTRRDLPFRVPVQLGIPGLQASSVRPLRTVGPVEGPLGQSWFELFGPVEAYAVFAGQAARPTLALTQARLPRFRLGGPPGGGSYTVEISGGSVWILASALDAALPGDRYIGFTVASGSLVFTSAPSVTGQQLTCAGPLEATLEVKPATPAAAPPGAGQCQADVSASPPSKLSVTWGAGNPPAVKLGAGSASFAGQTVKFTGFTSTITEQTALEAVLFEYRLTPSKLDLGVLAGEILTPEGETSLSGGWAVTLGEPVDPERPGEALGPGFYLLFAQTPVKARWPGANASVELPTATLTLSEGQLTLGCTDATTSPAVQQTLELYALRDEAGAPRLPLELTFGPASFTFAYVCDAENGEGLYAACGAELRVDRPIDATGHPLAFGEATPALLALLRREGATTVTAIGLAAALESPAGLPRSLLALSNALLAVTGPAMFLLRGTLNGEQAVDSGQLTLVLGNEGWLPTLPDPYVSNFARSERGAFGEHAITRIVLAASAWQEPVKPVLGFLGVLPAPAAGPIPAVDNAPRGLAQSEEEVRVPTQTQQGSVVRGGERHPVRSEALAQTAAAGDSRGEDLELQRQRVNDFQALASKALPGLGQGLRLLDVSTNKDLLGVEFGAGAGEETKVVARRTAEAAQLGAQFALAGMDVLTPSTNLRVFTLPQVQWEPVRTLDVDQDLVHIGSFPTPLASATDGGATLLGVSSARLVATIPDLAVDAALEAFEGGTEMAMLTTLPFGLKALLALKPGESLDGRSPDGIARNQPEFAPQALQGGAQLMLVAGSGPSDGAMSASFEGAALQLLNGVELERGVPLDISVLGSPLDPTASVQRIFNDEFAPGTQNPRVPLTRLDISGYGESTFSEWLDPGAVYASTAKAQFEVLVGRTALEVIKVASMLYPWGIAVTRTVTVERTAGAGVIRRDSGWQASSPGVFNFPSGASTAPDYLVEPGLLFGLSNVRNVRPTGGLPVEFLSTEGSGPVVLVPKYFDADAKIDGLEGPETVAALGLLGFLQVEPVGERLGERDLAAVIEQQGPIGGPVDGTVQVGESGFRLRATRIEVGSAEEPAGGRPELVGVLRGAPIFHQDGAWSSIRRPGPGNPQGEGEAVGVDGVQGVPVVREGLLTAGNASKVEVASPGEYRFADPADLHQPDAPLFEYGFMQVSPAHAFLFPRPYINPAVPELNTRSVPYFADIYARATARGVFPPNANVIELPANAMLVDPANGSMKLRDPIDITGPRGPLILATNGADVVQLDYDQAHLTSSLEADTWTVALTDVQLWSDLLGIKKFFGWSSDLQAGTGERPVIENINTLMAEEFKSALEFLPGFSAPPTFPPVDLTATNMPGLIQIALAVTKGFQIPPAPAPPPRVEFAFALKGTLGWKHAVATAAAGAPKVPAETVTGAVLLSAQAQGEFLIAPVILVVGLQVQAGAKFLVGTESPPGTSITPAPSSSLTYVVKIKAYVGAGIETGILRGSLSIGIAITIEATVVKWGPLVLLQARIELAITTVKVTGEFKGLKFEEKGKTFCEWGGTLEINISLGFIGIQTGIEITEKSEV